MIKYLLLAFTLFSLCMSINMDRGSGQIVSGKLTPDVFQVANWTISQMPTFTGLSGVYTINNITNVRIQIVRGIKYLLKIK
jgi:hypothetical protein